MKLRARDILDRAGGTGKRLHSFTLLEILIAVAALGLIAVGVASIFAATGKTVTTGRRVSAFNSYASLIEQQLRTDIASMTRDGFLVIRNEIADGNGNGTIQVTPPGPPGGDLVPLYDGEEVSRLRRTDELVFFAKGQYTSARGTLHPAYAAHADAARIYYGHGQRRIADPNVNPNNRYLTPQVSLSNADIEPNARLGYDATGVTNPNRYASEWTLLRHVTLLSPPRTAELTPPNPTPFNLAPNMLQDSPIQITLQPAASSIFRSLLNVFPIPAQLPPHIRTETQANHPDFQGGMVDIAAIDLPLIRSIVMSTNIFPGAADARFFIPTDNQNVNDTGNAGVDNLYRMYGPSPQDPDVIEHQHSWMSDAFPTWSDGPANQRSRIRYESAPVNYVGALDRAQWASDSEAAYRAADQVMLSTANFLPRCTEFIVEWSFGKTYPSDPSVAGYSLARAGKLIWHGMRRQVDTEVVADYYNDADSFVSISVPFNRVNGSAGTHPVLTRLIHPEALISTRPGPGDPLTSYFGYNDPTFNPDSNGNGSLDDLPDSISPTIPWAWPKLIRVTLSLADPNDPTIERTFQFVFQVPDRDGV